MQAQRQRCNSSEVTHRVRWTLAAGGLLGIQAALLAYGAYIHSPTLNEPGHLVAGISNWVFGRFDIYNVNPPVTRMVAAAPVLLAGAKTDWHRFSNWPGARSEFPLGEDFVAANGERSLWLFTLARWACIPLSLLGGVFCYRWATQMYGVGAGLFSLAVWCFCPNILAHGQLITSDAAAASLSIAAGYTLWRWLRQPTWWHTIASGLTLGLAELAKMSLLIFVPLGLFMWLVYRWQERRRLSGRDWLRELAMSAARILLATYVVNLGYGFEGTGTQLRDFKFVSASLGAEGNAEKAPIEGGNRFAKSWIGTLPMPFPRNYISGLDIEKRDFENYPEPSYLRGEFSNKGWWYYYFYALAIKVPLGTWLLIGLAITRRLWLRQQSVFFSNSNSQLRSGSIPNAGAWPDEFAILFPAFAMVVFVSLQTGFSEHMRYVLPAFPFVFVWMSRIVSVFSRRHWVFTSLAITGLVWSISSSLLVYPSCLSYFNELVGGPLGGPEHLLHSNVDWGQDLLNLKKWMDHNPEAKPMNLIYFGCFDPKLVGIDYVVPEQLLMPEAGPLPISTVQPGWYAISANFVRGFPYVLYKGDGTKGWLQQDTLAAFRGLKPLATAGYSLYIYHVEK
jgi:4-amino-4-deoxy-L-arabinose transferase-like glycosyltransferase